MVEHSVFDDILADSLTNLAACNEMTGKLQLAADLYREALELRRVVHGEQSLQFAESLQNLGLANDQLGHLHEAEQQMREALAIHQKELGHSAPESSVLLNNLAVLLRHQGKVSAAREILERVVELRVTAYGPNHFFTACAKRNLKYAQNREAGLVQMPSRGGRGKLRPVEALSELPPQSASNPNEE